MPSPRSEHHDTVRLIDARPGDALVFAPGDIRVLHSFQVIPAGGSATVLWSDTRRSLVDLDRVFVRVVRGTPLPPPATPRPPSDPESGDTDV